MSLVEQVTEALYDVIDPELDVNIVDLGLVYNVEADADRNIQVTMTLTTPGCPLHDSIVGGVRNRISEIEGIGKIDVQLVWEPAWNPTMMTDRGKLQLWG